MFIKKHYSFETVIKDTEYSMINRKKRKKYILKLIPVVIKYMC